MRLHNNFSCAWLETVSSALSIAAQQSGVADEFVAFARSGCISAARHSRLFWAGDQLTSWDSRDGIGSALTAVCFPLLFFCSADLLEPYCIVSPSIDLFAAADGRFVWSPCLALRHWGLYQCFPSIKLFIELQSLQGDIDLQIVLGLLRPFY
jgi:hypothetical protein